MINFTQQYLNLNRSNIEEVHVQNLCLYFEKLNTHLCQFLSTLDQLEKNHAEIKEVKEKTKELKLLITNGNFFLAQFSFIFYFHFICFKKLYHRQK